MAKKNSLPALKARILAGFESSETLTPEFKAFATSFKSAIKSELERVGATLLSFNRGHFNCSGFYKVGERFGYFSLHDVRHPMNTDNLLMFREAKSEKDYTGLQNNHGDLDDQFLAEKMVKLIK